MSTSTIWSFTTYVRGPSGMIPPIRRLVRLTNRFWITLRSFLHDMLQQTQLLSGYETGRVRGSFPEFSGGYVGWFPGKTYREFAPFLEGNLVFGLVLGGTIISWWKWTAMAGTSRWFLLGSTPVGFSGEPGVSFKGRLCWGGGSRCKREESWHPYKNHVISTPIIWRSQNHAKNRVKPLCKRVQWFKGMYILLIWKLGIPWKESMAKPSNQPNLRILWESE